MNKTLLITGAGPRGVTGKLIKEYFEAKYNLLTPGSSELDLTDDYAVSHFFTNHKIDYVIHCATFRPTSVHNGHFVDEELESNLRMFYALASQSAKFEKMIYFGSGAEFDKSNPIIEASETEFGRSIPKNKYGLGKYIMNTYTSNSDNIINFRLFGTINKYERPDKNVISNICIKAIKGKPLNLKKNCRFSFVDIEDVLPLLEYALCHNMKHKDYNITNGNPCFLSDIGDIISSFMNENKAIVFEKEGLNNEYTGSNIRLQSEHPIHFTPLHKSIKKVYDYYTSISDDINVDNIDNRWK